MGRYTERYTPACLLPQDEKIDVEVLNQGVLDKHHANFGYLDEHLEGYLRRYPDHWIAVGNQRIVGRNRTEQGLLRNLGKRGIEIMDVILVGRGYMFVPILEVVSSK